MPCSYSFSQFTVTGDCQNNGSGGFTLYLSSTSEPMSITWFEPNPWPPYGGPTTELNVMNGPREYLNVSAGTYVFTVNDSCGSPGDPTQNNRETINITVSSGSSCVNIDGVISTTCGLENGILTATTENINGTATMILFQNGLSYRTAFTDTTSYVFTDLPSGIYYVNANNGGGCTGSSENVIVEPSFQLDYGLYIVNDADCGNVNSGVGKLFITGLTGVSPYTYLWSSITNPQYLPQSGQVLTGSSITGLTEGAYSVTVTDSQNCTLTKTGIITEIDPVTIASVTPTPPTCFDENGEITITVKNGVAPYRYYIPSRSFIDISYSQTYVFSGLPGGNYEIIVTDSALCETKVTVQLNQPDSFSVSSVNVKNAVCGNANGALSILLIGDRNKTYTYSLSGQSGSVVSKQGSTLSNFTQLTAGQYLLTITDGNCTFSQVYTVNSVSSFTATTFVTGTTCGEDNGVIRISVTTGGTGLYTYSIVKNDGTGNQTATNTGTSSYTFNNLSSGVYSVKVEDQSGCEEIQYSTVNSSQNVNFILLPTSSTNGSNGQIYANIYEGTPPFSLTWSSNVNGQTGLTVSNLSAGTYSLTVIDNSGCTLTNTVVLEGTFNVSTTVLFNICESELTTTNNLIERSLGKMLVEGYLDLTSGCTDCLLSNAVFSAVTNVGGTGYSISFFTANTLTDVPTTELWGDTITDLISGATGVGNVVLDSDNNTITVSTSCEDTTIPLANQNLTIQLKIVYDINCVSC